MKNSNNAREVTRVSNGHNCDGMETITYFSGARRSPKKFFATLEYSL